MNIVVMTMLFLLLPFYLAVTKVALRHYDLCAGALICRLLPQVELPEDELICAIPVPDVDNLGQETVTNSALEVGKSHLQNRWYIVKMTVPLMLLAGTLGAATATVLPAGIITGLPFSILILFGVALIGLFLPAPIAFVIAQPLAPPRLLP